MQPGENPSVLDRLRQTFLAQELEGLTEGQLLERFVAGREEGVFALLVRRLGPMVLGVCRRVLGHEQDAEDAFQATFLVLARKAATVKPREKVANWLYGVAWRTAREARVMAARRRSREQVMARVPERASASEEEPDWRSALDEELARLPEKYRLPVVLCELQGKTHKDAAEQLGWPVGTVSGRLSRARGLLARRLRKHGLGVSAGALALGLTVAAVPPALAAGTARAAVLAAGGGPVVGLSAHVLALTERVLKVMLMTRLKVGLGVVAAVLLLGGAGLGWHYAAGAGGGPERRAESGPPPAKKAPAGRKEAEPEPPGGKAKTEPAGVPLEARLVVKKRTYTLDLGGKTAEQVRDQIKKAESADGMPPAPEVDLVFQIKNTGRKDLQLWTGGDGPRLDLELKGPAALSVDAKKAFTLELRAPVATALGPGKTYEQPVKQLMYGHRGISHHAYWLKPGEYTLTAVFHTAVSPTPKGAKPAANDFGMKDFGAVKLISAPVKLKVEAKK
jgi:RNA polymerase sigma factor (sigma-70 family)